MVKNEKKKTRKSGSSSSKKPKRASKIGAITPKSNGIEMSKQLLRSIQKSRPRANRSCHKRNSMEIICGKQHMPPLSELEKMYEESDDEIGETSSVDCKSQITSSNVIISPTSISPTSISPTSISPTAKKYADEILKIIKSNEAPSPIIPLKTSKKSEVPYIVNSTENPRVPENGNCNVFKNDDITNKTNAFSSDENCFEGHNCSVYSLSKSNFNAQANDIASKLLVTNHKPICGNSDSDDTVVYELNTPLSRFSPTPSFSKDSKIISNNDERFYECLMARNKYNNTVNNRVEHVSKITIVNKGELGNIDERMKDCIARETVISKLNINNVNFTEQPCETIEIDDDDDYDTCNMDVQTKANKCISKNNSLNTQMETRDQECVIIDKISNNIKCINNVKDNKCIYINRSPVILEDVFDPHIIPEIDLTNINVDDVISQNKSIIDKYSKHNTLNTINIVQDDRPNSYSVEDTIIYENASNKQLRSKGNHNNVTQTNKLEHIMKHFFDNIENIVHPNNQGIKAVKSLSSQERILPQCTLNNSVNSQQSLSQNVESYSKTLLGTCPICLDNLSKETVGSTNCGHLFCMHCITKALNRKPKRCPTCRKKLAGTGFHQIFM